MAQPVGDADRQVQKALQKPVRGSSERERQAPKALTNEAQVVADYGVAIRTVRRDAGTSPIEPPGLKLYQTVPRMAASVERVMGAPPSALLNKLSRMLAVLKLFQQEGAQ